MKWMSKNRQRLGVTAVASVVSALLLSSSHAVTQGKTGPTSSGSFSITLIIPPTLQSQITVASEDDVDDQGKPIIMTTDTLSLDEPVSFCVAGRGIDQFSLSSEGVSGVSLEIQDGGNDSNSLLTETASETMPSDENCQSSTRELVATASDDFQGSTEAAVVMIHVE